MKKEEFIKAIEELNLEYLKLYYSDVLKKYRHKQRIKKMIINRDFRGIYWLFYDSIFKKSHFRKYKINPSFSKKRKGKIVVYTCILNDYDALLDPILLTENTDYIVFSDNENITENSKIWQYQKIPNYVLNKCKNNFTLVNRYIKMHPSEFFKDYDYALYVDGNVHIISDIAGCFNLINDKTGLAMHEHRTRDDIYIEAHACLRSHKGNKEAIKALVKKYRQEKIPEHFGLFEATIIASDLKNKQSTHLLNKWYLEFLESNTLRDQLSFTYILFKNNLTCDDVGLLGRNIALNPKFRIYDHSVFAKKNLRTVKGINKYSIFRKVKRRIDYFGLKFKCPICQSRLRVFKDGKICPVCNTFANERALFYYLKAKSEVFNDQKNVLCISDFKVLKYKLQKAKHNKAYMKDIDKLDDLNKKIRFDYIVLSSVKLNKNIVSLLKNKLSNSRAQIIALGLDDNSKQLFKEKEFTIKNFEVINSKYGIDTSIIINIITKKE